VASDFPANKYRADFPILDQKVNGHPLVYLDNAASTQRPASVIDEIARYYREDHANVHRGIHALSARSTKLYENARSSVSKFLGAGSSDSIIFTRGTTEGINLVASSWGSAHLVPGDTVLITEMEHHANLIPWQIITRRTGATLRYMPIEGDEGHIDWSMLERRLQKENVRLLAFTQISNTLGCVNPYKKYAPSHGAMGWSLWWTQRRVQATPLSMFRSWDAIFSFFQATSAAVQPASAPSTEDRSCWPIWNHTNSAEK
jgi:cysteine desulfurase/selenocysteine lyase